MSAKTTCDNPMCTCDPCGCADCRCGAARLGDLERRVMQTLWESHDQELTGRDVTGALAGYAYTTVATVLDRLVHKGLVSRRMDGRTIHFSAIGTRSAYTAVRMREALSIDGDSGAALVRFAETLSRSEASALRKALDTLERKSTGGAR